MVKSEKDVIRAMTSIGSYTNNMQEVIEIKGFEDDMVLVTYEKLNGKVSVHKLKLLENKFQGKYFRLNAMPYFIESFGVVFEAHPAAIA